MSSVPRWVIVLTVCASVLLSVVLIFAFWPDNSCYSIFNGESEVHLTRGRPEISGKTATFIDRKTGQRRTIQNVITVTEVKKPPF